MARPIKDGVDYFPLDVDFLQNDDIRMIRAEYGARGILIVIALYSKAYESAGYFYKWDDDSCLLMADAISCGITPDLIRQVVQVCIKRSLFDSKVFTAHSVLTSPGIQRRYMRMIGNRSEIEIIKEYWLLDLNSRKDVPASVLNRLAFKKLKTDYNGDKSNFNLDKTSGNAESKEKQSKAKEIKVKDGREYSHFFPIAELDQFKSWMTDNGWNYSDISGDSMIAKHSDYGPLYLYYLDGFVLCPEEDAYKIQEYFERE